MSYIVKHTLEKNIKGEIAFVENYLDTSSKLEPILGSKSEAFHFKSLQQAKSYIEIVTEVGRGSFSWDDKRSYSAIYDWFLDGITVEIYCIEDLK